MTDTVSLPVLLTKGLPEAEASGRAETEGREAVNTVEPAMVGLKGSDTAAGCGRRSTGGEGCLHALKEGI
eukprot:scaffold610624_cov39-Prasinocladus_malaysianus.AAC.1